MTRQHFPLHPGAAEHYEDAAAYDCLYEGREEDVAYYARAARKAGRVLEYGAGSGRVTVPMARAGAHVYAVELSEAMLAELRKKTAREAVEVRKRIQTRRADMRSVRLRRKWPLVIAPFNTFQHLYNRSDVEAFLAGVRAHLEPAGRFVFDVYVPRPHELAGGPAISNAPNAAQSSFDYDPMSQVLTTEIHGGVPSNRRPRLLAHRQFFPRELELLLHYNGFSRIRFRADFTNRAPDAGTETLVVSCAC